MIGLSTQSWAAIAIVAMAAGYLGYLAWRTLRRGGQGAGCCSTGCPSARQDTTEPPASDRAQPFVPLDSLAELARRHKEERDRSEQAR
jgi:hypothetical protein